MRRDYNEKKIVIVQRFWCMTVTNKCSQNPFIAAGETRVWKRHFRMNKGRLEKTYIKQLLCFIYFVLSRFSRTRFKLFSFLNGKFITYSIYYIPRSVPVIPYPPHRSGRFGITCVFICCPAAINPVVSFGTQLRVHHRRDVLRVYTFRFYV